MNTIKSSSNAFGREIIITRLLDAPRKQVWKAWADPESIVRWWGPNGFTTETHEMDFRPEGVWKFTMRAPNGTEYKNRIIYTDIQPESLVRYRHSGDEETVDVRFETTVTFEEQGAHTELTLRMVFESPEDRERVEKEFGAREGGKQTLARLAEYVEDV